jgi:sugar phosphate isomerase/epimerase
MFSTTTSRRDFLRLGATSLAVAAIPTLASGKDEDPYGGFKFGCQSYTFRNFKLEPALKKIKDLGLHYAEFYNAHVPLNSTPEQIKAVLSLCKDHEITPIAFGVESFTKDHDANKKKFEFAAALGIKSLSADPTEDSFDSLDKLVDEYKIAIAIHPHGPSGDGKNRHHWWSAEVILKAVKDHHKLIGTCLDTGHLIRMAQLGEMLDPAQQIRVMGERNFGIHLKDHNNKTRRDVVYGQDGGVLNVGEVLKALKDVKFTGSISIEYEHNPADPTADVKACVDVVKEAVKKLS